MDIFHEEHYKKIIEVQSRSNMILRPISQKLFVQCMYIFPTVGIFIFGLMSLYFLQICSMPQCVWGERILCCEIYRLTNILHRFVFTKLFFLALLLPFLVHNFLFLSSSPFSLSPSPIDAPSSFLTLSFILCLIDIR